MFVKQRLSGVSTLCCRLCTVQRAQRLRSWPCHANASDEVAPEASSSDSSKLPVKISYGTTAPIEGEQSLDQKASALRAELEHLKANEKGLPHRWIVVIAMIAAFVLCNMDKVWSRFSVPDK